MKNYKTFYENTIIDSIDFDGYGLNNDMYLYDKIKTLYNIFKREYGYNIKIMGEVKAFKEWLQGLPSSCTVPFYNYQILENAKNAGLLKEAKTKKGIENEENDFLNEYWFNLSTAFFTLKDNL